MSTLKDAIEFFLESCSLEREPDSTLTERVLILRILYSILSIDASASVSALHDQGVFIGQHDAKHMLNVHHEQRLTVMDAHATFALLNTISTVHWADLVAELQEAYVDAPSRSPLLSLRRVFEEAVGAPDARAAVFVRVFLALYNWECARDALMTRIFDECTDIGNARDLVMRVLGSQMTNARGTDIMTDVCAALKWSVFEGDALGVLGAAPLKKPSESASMTARRGRLRLSAFRSELLQGSAGGSGKALATTWKPSGLPMVAEVWQSMSTAQQQLVLLVSSIDRAAIASVDRAVAMIYCHHNADARFFDAYEPDLRDTDKIAQNIFLVLSRVRVSAESEGAGALFLANSFIDALFSSTLGLSQQQSMSAAVKVQIFIAAYLRPKIRQQVFMLITRHYNERAFGARTELYLPQTMTTHVQAIADQWIQRNKFADALLHDALLPLCV